MAKTTKAAKASTSKAAPAARTTAARTAAPRTARARTSRTNARTENTTTDPKAMDRAREEAKKPAPLSAEDKKSVDERILPTATIENMKKTVSEGIKKMTDKLNSRDAADREDASRYETLLPHFNTLYGSITNVESAQEAVAEQRRQELTLKNSIERDQKAGISPQ